MSQALAETPSKTPWDKHAAVCYYCKKKEHLKGDCLKKTADDANENKKPDGGRREGGGECGAPPRAALAYAVSALLTGTLSATGSTRGSFTWVLKSGATRH